MNMSGASPGQLKEDVFHTYMNTGSARPDSTGEAFDVDFLTDANVYYNLPPPLPTGHSRGASLPRGHLKNQHQQLARAYSSCPASPKLPPSALTSCKNNSTTLPETTHEKKGQNVTSPPVKQRALKPRSLKLSHTRSFDLDHLYQNLVRVASKPRSNSISIDLPWRRKKAKDSTQHIKEDGAIGLPSVHLTPAEEAECRPNICQDYPRSIPETPDTRTSYSTSTSSSSDNSESEGVAEDCSAEVCPGVTYLRESAQRIQAENSSAHEDAINSWYHTAATLPLRKNKNLEIKNECRQKIGQRQALDINANLDEWLRKERWLEKKLISRNHRLAGDCGKVDITILYASDGLKWKNYLYDVFTQLVPKEEGSRGIRVEVMNVEDIKDNIGRLQAVKLKGAKLQIIILSPYFLTHIAEHGRSELGQVFIPQKVLALLLGVDDSQFTMAHLSALYSYNDWHRLKVRNMDLDFICEVLSESINILNSCELYEGYNDERAARFKVTPRKVNMMQQQVYILLKDPLKKKSDAEVLIEGPNKCTTTIKEWRLRNAYTIDFRMPEEFLKGSSLLLVTVLVDKKMIGSRQVKCESNMDSLRDILASVSNPTDFMCQALNISPTSDELDQRLADAVRFHLPLHKLESNILNRDVSEFPTWIHFSAFYGLERLTWALLEIPGGEAALNSPNCHGHTPSVLAYQKGFSLLAQTLEDAALVSSLAAKVGYASLCKSVSLPSDNQTSEEIYSSPPPPRPLVPHNTLQYDPLPAPREVMPSTVTTSPQRTEIPETSVTLPSLSPVLSRIHDMGEGSTESQEVLPSPSPGTLTNLLSSPAPSLWTENRDSEKQEDPYLDMNVLNDCRHRKVYEYSADVYTLVTAWMEKTNIKTFVENHQDKIIEVKSKLDSNKVKENGSEFAESEEEAVSHVQGETINSIDKLVSDSARQKTMVEQFFGLLRGRRKQPRHFDIEGSRLFCDLPNDYIDDPTQGGAKGTPSGSDDETGCHSVTLPGKVGHPSLEPTSSDFVYAVAGTSGNQLRNEMKKIEVQKQEIVSSASNSDMARLNISGVAKETHDVTGYPTLLAEKHQEELEYASVD
ncbi:uncharacterized protein stumps isoform X2 [Panulirus ornatus]|uniref:uncharacterized protein stumps isoform X2 n=1 Tax=Panulirus ornatus TaxID=150431 RepID=UPI003A8395AA